MRRPVSQRNTSGAFQWQSKLTCLVEGDLDETRKPRIDDAATFEARIIVDDATKMKCDARISVVVVPPIDSFIFGLAHDAQRKLSCRAAKRVALNAERDPTRIR